MEKKKKRILLKLSGASLKSNDESICFEFLNDLALQIKELSKNYEIGIVLGGGNIWRGNVSHKYNMPRHSGDYMGMLATLMNSLAMESSLTNLGLNAKIFSSLEVLKIAEPNIIKNINDSLAKGRIVIFAGGTGIPFFSTDTGAAVRAAEMGAEFILMGKNNVDGVYSEDPFSNPNATFYEKLSYDEVIKRDLKIMDISAISICREYQIKLMVFRIDAKNSIINALSKKCKFTIIE